MCCLLKWFTLLALKIKVYYKLKIINDPRQRGQGLINQAWQTCTPYDHTIIDIYKHFVYIILEEDPTFETLHWLIIHEHELKG